VRMHRFTVRQSSGKRGLLIAAVGLLYLLASRTGSGQCPNGGVPNGGCTLPPSACGCNPPLQPNQCFPDTTGPAFWLDPGTSAGTPTSQERTALKSPRTTVYSQLPTGSRPNCDGVPLSPQAVVSVRQVGRRIMVDYDIPNYYCLNAGDWPPSYTCRNDIEASTERLTLRQGTTVVLKRSWIYYENGTWDTGYDVPCPSSNGYSAAVRYSAGNPLQSVVVESPVVVLPAEAPCPPPPTRDVCPVAGGAGTSAAQPINIGSGDVSVGVPLFALAQSPLSLSFGLSYHSESPVYPALMPSPLGTGWTHTFAQVFRPIPSTNRLLHLTAGGLEHEFTQSGATWVASLPGDLRGTVTQVGSEYRLTDLDGTVTRFDLTTGRWLSTTDRWLNAITGSYTGSDLTAITDSMGRQITLSYASGLLTQITLPDGSLWRFGYNGTPSRLEQIFDPLHTGATPWRTFQYQSDSAAVIRLLTAMKDDGGFLLEGHAYDVQDRGTSSVSEGGRNSVTILYGGPGVPALPVTGARKVTHAIDGTTNQVSYFTLTYQKGRYLPLSIEGVCSTCGGAENDTQSFSYSSDNFLLSKIDGAGQTTSFAVDANGNVTQRTEPGTPVRVTNYEYSYAPWPRFQTRVLEPSAAKPGQQKITTNTWNAGETQLTTSVSGFLKFADPSPTVYTTTTLFDARHRETEVDGPAANQKSTFVYYADADATLNRRGRLQQTSLYTSATAHLDTQYDTYDVFGTAKKVVDPNGVETDNTTDSKGRVRNVVSKQPAGDPNPDYTTIYAFDLRDRLTDVTLPLLNKLHYEYEDGTNRLLDTIRVDTSGNQQERLHLTLNVIGGKTQEEAQVCTVPAPTCLAANWSTKRSDSFSYDTHNRLFSVVHPDASASHIDYTYDSRGNLIAVKDERHTSANTLYAYDSLKRLTTVTQKRTIVPGSDVVTQYAYDLQDNLTSVTDPNGNVTSFAYDDFRRMQTQTSPVSGTTSYSYDAAGNLTSSTDANSIQTTRTYDAANRSLATVSGTGGAQENVTWTYDSPTAGNYGQGRLATMTDPSGSTSYAYERRGLLRSESRTIQGDPPYSLGYGYDKNGNRSLVTYPSGRAVNYTFDFADRPFSATSGSTTYVASASYAPFGPETRLAFGNSTNSTTKTTTYDNRYRPSENKLVKDIDPANPLARYAYSEDAVGNITSICAAQPCSAPSDPYDRVLGYDDLNRLITASSGSSLWGAGSYAYDSMGNTTSLTLGSRSVTFAYVQAGGHQTPKLATASDHTPTTVSYDAAGNETSVGGVTYPYSTRNLLTSGDGIAYTYDGRGLRTVTNTNLSGAAPTVSSINPNTGTTAGGTAVTIGGTNFQAGATVSLGGVAATGVTVTAPDTIHATTGAHAAGAVDVVVTNSDTQSGTLSGGFNYTSTAPTVTGINPNTGTTAGGTAVTIGGTNFQTGATVSLGGVAATGVTVTPPDTIHATTGAHAAGSVDVVVTNSDAQSGTLSGGFTYVAPPPMPTITSFAPTSAVTGTSVTINGTNLANATSVTFNGVSANITSDTSIQIKADVPTDATTGKISVTTPGGTAMSAGTFTVKPNITDFMPTSGGVGAQVTINGSGFSGATSVKFNGTAATIPASHPSTQIVTNVPANATTGKITVTTPGGTATSASDFTVAPRITSFSPTNGPIATSVTITGANLANATSVKFNGISTSITSNTSTQIKAPVPSGATTGPISVTTSAGTATSATNFTVNLTPSISGFSPSSGAVGLSVTINGMNFTGVTSVKFNGTAAIITSKTDIQLKATVPTNATTGKIAVTTPGGTATSATDFTVAPRITSFSPTSGPEGTSVTINGANFTGTTSVKFNGTSAGYGVTTSIKIMATVPAGATTGKISVTTAAGTATSAGNFTVKPNITGFAPTSGKVGDPVTITGTTFTGASVKFNGTTATINSNNGTVIQTAVPANATTGPISVTTPGGTATSASNFTVAPRVTSFTPTSGAVGTSVTITGANLANATSVKFNGTSTSITSNTSTQIKAPVPSGATTGPISVTTSAGTATSSTNFTVTGGLVEMGSRSKTLAAADTLARETPSPDASTAEQSRTLILSAAELPLGAAPPRQGGIELLRMADAEEKLPVERVASLRLAAFGADYSATEFSLSLRDDWLSAENWAVSGDSGLPSRMSKDMGPGSESGSADRDAEATVAVRPSAIATAGRRYSFYSPEMNLLAETEIKTTAGAPAILYEYVWFNGHPVAQVDLPSTTHWTFTDHLGTPLIQTDAAGAVYWRAEHEPYGKVFLLRTTDQHQPLRLPGQEAEQLNLGPDGVTERSYNIFRWYRPAWGRYTQTDPLGLGNAINLYSYGADRPTILIDPFGLRTCKVCDECPSGKWSFQGFGFSAAIPILWGKTRTWGTFSCEKGTLLKKVPVTIDCNLKGLILVVGGGVNFSVPIVPSACACNSQELYTQYESFYLTVGPFSAEIGDCSTGQAKTLTLGFGKSFGGGWADATCKVTPR
jgi:RHS repeat-associated protein